MSEFNNTLFRKFSLRGVAAFFMVIGFGMLCYIQQLPAEKMVASQTPQKKSTDPQKKPVCCKGKPCGTTKPCNTISTKESKLAEKKMKPYKQNISGTPINFEMVPIKGGTFQMGSSGTEKSRKTDEGPQHAVKIAPFWMGKCEVTWDMYEIWRTKLDIVTRPALKIKATEADKLADAITRPTESYLPMDFGMGIKGGYPAACMTQLAAKTFCKWLSAKTGHYYRLPTEAEWEYACRAGTTTAYSFGNDPKKLGDYAWFSANSNQKYQKVGKKKPNPWGLHDMHGNVAEWVLDQYDPKYYAKNAKNKLSNSPLNIATKEYPRVVRGGGWKQKADELRSASRLGSHSDWKEDDPQDPKSLWYHTQARSVGFRIVRPLHVPNLVERRKLKWEPRELTKEEKKLHSAGADHQ